MQGGLDGGDVSSRMFSPALLAEAEALLVQFRAQRQTLVTAESCTGGLIAALFTEIAGASDVFERGFVTYSNAAKQQCLSVPADVIEAHGAVSAAVASAMASGALAHSLASVALSVTGIAGPGGGSAEKPVGLVFIGLATHRKAAESHRYVFAGDRAAIRLQAVAAALQILKDID